MQFGGTNKSALLFFSKQLLFCFLLSETSIVKTRQANQWHHLPAYSCSKRGIAPGRGGVPCWRGWGRVHMSLWMQTSTTRWLHFCVSNFNHGSLWFCFVFGKKESTSVVECFGKLILIFAARKKRVF